MPHMSSRRVQGEFHNYKIHNNLIYFPNFPLVHKCEYWRLENPTSSYVLLRSKQCNFQQDCTNNRNSANCGEC